MQHNVQCMIGNPIRAIDGDLGNVHGFYFDNETWTMRYLVVETGNWLPRRKVLVSLAALCKPAGVPGTFSVDISREQVLRSPDMDLEKPVSRQDEVALLAHYGWPQYWTTAVEDTGEAMQDLVMQNPELSKVVIPRRKDNPLLRSTRQVTGYHVPTTDNEIGHVEDFIVDIENWALRFLVVDTGDWLPARKVLVPPAWIERINWAEKTVHLHRSYEPSDTVPDFDRRKTSINFPQEIDSASALQCHGSHPVESFSIKQE